MKMTFVIMTNTDLLKVVPCKLVESCEFGELHFKIVLRI